MQLSVEILDHIFSFLVSHQATLFACSQDPLLSPIVERHLYYHITVHFGIGEGWPAFRPDRLSKLVSENPHILYYVRILEIKVKLEHNYYLAEDLDISNSLDQFSKTLLTFPVLECIRLTSFNRRAWHWPHVFRAALEDRLNLPTVRKVYLEGNQVFPPSLIGKNIKNLLLSGSLKVAKGVDSTPQPLQLESLSLTPFPDISRSLLAWVKLHINELRSLKCAESLSYLPELLGVCSGTLNKLDIDFALSRYYTKYTEKGKGKTYSTTSVEVSPVLPNLQQLIIRAPVYVNYVHDMHHVHDIHVHDIRTYLPAAAEIINSFVPPPRHLLLDIDIDLLGIPSSVAEIDFSPLAVLGAAALLIPRIDLYIHTGLLSSTDTLAQLLSSLEDYEDVARSIEAGVLVIHSEKAVPDP